MKKLAIVTTHPIQYNAPFFKLLTERGKVRLKVFYTWAQAIKGFDDPDFGKQIKWDIPLLEGYDWEVVENISKKPSSKYWSGIDCPKLIDSLEVFGPDIVMVYGWNLKSHFRVMRYFKGKIPVWFFGDSTLLDEKPGIKRILRRIWLTFVYRHIDKAFYVGTNNKAYFKAHGIKEDQLVFFPHAVDNDRFFDNEKRQYERKARRWRKELGYNDDDIVVLFAGKLEPKKNPLILLEVVKKINKSTNQQISLLYVGNGALEKELKEQSKDLAYVKFLPFQNQSDMPVVYRMGDVFCLPSSGPGETWGLAVNEALASERSALMSNKVGCAIDIVRFPSIGFIFEHDNVEQLYKALIDMLRCTNGTTKRSVNTLEFTNEWNYNLKCEGLEQEIEKSTN